MICYLPYNDLAHGLKQGTALKVYTGNLTARLLLTVASIALATFNPRNAHLLTMSDAIKSINNTEC